MATITCDCADTLPVVKNDRCALPGIGKQITGFGVQLMTGSDFDGTAISDGGTAGGDISLAADWQAKMAATDENKIIVIQNLAGTNTPEGTPQVLEGNDVAYGGRVLTDMARTITGRIDFPSLADIDAINRINKCIGKLRVYVWDDKLFVQGPILNANLTFSNLIRPGINQPLPPHFLFTLAWDSIEEADFQTAALTFISTLQAA